MINEFCMAFDWGEKTLYKLEWTNVGLGWSCSWVIEIYVICGRDCLSLIGEVSLCIFLVRHFFLVGFCEWRKFFGVIEKWISDPLIGCGFCFIGRWESTSDKLNGEEMMEILFAYLSRSSSSIFPRSDRTQDCIRRKWGTNSELWPMDGGL